MMMLKPIKSERDYEAALKAIEDLWNARPDSAEGDTLDILVTLVEAYERNRYEIPPPDPIAALHYYLESRGLPASHLESYIGSRGRVSEIMNRKRPLTLTMIRNLAQGTGIPASILIQPYATEQGGSQSVARDGSVDAAYSGRR